MIDSRYSPHGAATSPAGAVVYWHVDDVAATFAKLLAMGAKEHPSIIERGPGFITASVVDPFGNILGISHHDLVLAIAQGKFPSTLNHAL